MLKKLPNILRRSLSIFLNATLLLAATEIFATQKTDLPLYYWQQPQFVNFGDYLSVKVVERIIDRPVRIYKK
jgi:hypothetical protein